MRILLHGSRSERKESISSVEVEVDFVEVMSLSIGPAYALESAECNVSKRSICSWSSKQHTSTA